MRDIGNNQHIHAVECDHEKADAKHDHLHAADPAAIDQRASVFRVYDHISNSLPALGEQISLYRMNTR